MRDRPTGLILNVSRRGWQLLVGFKSQAASFKLPLSPNFQSPNNLVFQPAVQGLVVVASGLVGARGLRFDSLSGHGEQP